MAPTTRTRWRCNSGEGARSASYRCARRSGARRPDGLGTARSRKEQAGFAHHMTKVALSHIGIFLSDGATNVMPIAPHRGDNLSFEQQQENQDSVHNAWRIGFNHTTHSLINGLYQGWDLNPAQLPMRYAATYNFFLSSYSDATHRLKTFVERAAISTLTGDIFDDAATGQGLLNFFLKAINCGAITEEEATATGLSLDEIRTRSFYRILEGRRKK